VKVRGSNLERNDRRCEVNGKVVAIGQTSDKEKWNIMLDSGIIDNS